MPTVGVLGAGTMGAGIAQVAAAAGWQVRMLDVDAARVVAAIAGIRARLDRLAEKRQLAPEAAQAAGTRLFPASDPTELRDCALVIEAVVEDLEVKAQALARIAAVAPQDALFASNTSSLSITRIGLGAGVGPRMVGLHFFNPVPLMPLVEVIGGDHATPAAAQRAFEIAQQWGKTPVRAKDTPGFIVNRVARGYYLESLRLLEEGVATVSEIDDVLRRLGGFRMGPFELMDLIGIDVNYSVSGSVWEQMGRPARLTPHSIQRLLVERADLGRKSGRGFYSYDREPPVAAVLTERRSFALAEPLYAAVRRFVDGATPTAGSQTEQYILARVLAAILNEAAIVQAEGVASAADIDTAMKLGTNYPRGPFEWIEQIGRFTCAALLRALNAQSADGRFAPSGWWA